MLGSFGAALYRPLQAISSRNRPWQIAAAIALGIATGVLLNQSVLGVACLGLLFFLPIHYPTAIVAALLCAGLAPLLEPLYGALGGWALRQNWILSPLASLHRLPLFPWLRLNNTVVMGAALAGLIQTLPMFLLAQRFFIGCKDAHEDAEYRRWQQESTREKILQVTATSPTDELDMAPEIDDSTEALGFSPEFEEPTFTAVESEDTADDDLLEPAESITEETEVSSSLQDDEETFAASLLGDTTSASSFTSDQPDEESSSPKIHRDEQPETPSSEDDVDSIAGQITIESNETELVEPIDQASVEDEALTLEFEQRLEATTREDLSNATADEVAARAAELAELVDEMLTAIQDEDVQAALDAETTPELKGTDSPFRIVREPEPEDADTGENRRDYSQSPINGDLRRQAMETETDGVAQDSDRPFQKTHGPHEIPYSENALSPTTESQADPALTTETPPVTLQEVAQHEEALRYLLHHLKEIKNKV